jgi:ribosomal protein S18 acetylase RimI-like enzyme
MGRLAVSADEQGNRYGELLLAQAVHRCLVLREQLGVRVLLVDTLHERAVALYRTYGFRETTTHARTLYLPLGKA